MKTDISDFIRFLQTLPLGEIEIAGTLTGGAVCTAKRVVCVRDKEDGKLYLIVNPMGSHFNDEFYVEHERVGTFQP